MTINTKDIIAYCAIAEEGDWDRIYQRLLMHDYPSPEKIESTLLKLKCQYLSIVDEGYPEKLRQIHRPPFCLFYYGDISLINTETNQLVSVVGSREYSEYGESATRHIVSDLARDFVIVSGLAKGIDTIAAETAINAGGKTVAVLGSGPNICYPRENRELYSDIKRNHLILSEYPPNICPSQEKFPLRNRIIAGLSKAVIVTEAGLRSGTSITVNFALLSNRDVMCVPHPYNSASACNRLIKEGAFLVENGDDVRNQISKY